MQRVHEAKVSALTRGGLAGMPQYTAIHAVMYGLTCQKSAEAIVPAKVAGKGRRITGGKVGKFKGYA